MERMGGIIAPVRRIWGGAASRLRFRRSGLPKLQRDVRACEYEDVHKMWEMLMRNEEELGQSGKYKKSSPCRDHERPVWNLFGWAQFARCLGGRNFS